MSTAQTKRMTRIRHYERTEGEHRYRYGLYKDTHGEELHIFVELTAEGGDVTAAWIDGGFRDEGTALAFFLKIGKFLVTPSELAYVYEDELLFWKSV